MEPLVREYDNKNMMRWDEDVLAMIHSAYTFAQGEVLEIHHLLYGMFKFHQDDEHSVWLQAKNGLDLFKGFQPHGPVPIISELRRLPGGTVISKELVDLFDLKFRLMTADCYTRSEARPKIKVGRINHLHILKALFLLPGKIHLKRQLQTLGITHEIVDQKFRLPLAHGNRRFVDSIDLAHGMHKKAESLASTGQWGMLKSYFQFRNMDHACIHEWICLKGFDTEGYIKRLVEASDWMAISIILDYVDFEKSRRLREYANGLKIARHMCRPGLASRPTFTM